MHSSLFRRFILSCPRWPRPPCFRSVRFRSTIDLAVLEPRNIIFASSCGAPQSIYSESGGFPVAAARDFGPGRRWTVISDWWLRHKSLIQSNLLEQHENLLLVVNDLRQCPETLVPPTRVLNKGRTKLLWQDEVAGVRRNLFWPQKISSPRFQVVPERPVFILVNPERGIRRKLGSNVTGNFSCSVA